jgi:uncharacterized protein (DUF433 family)
MINPNAKLTGEKVKDIIAKHYSGVSRKNLHSEYGVSMTCINDIISGDSWQEIERPVNLNKGTKEKQLLSLPSLTELQMDIIIGGLLGDGCISGSNKNKCYCKNHSISSEEYIIWTYEKLCPYSSCIYYGKQPKIKCVNKKIVRITGYSKFCGMKTHSHPFLTQLREKWYRNGIKMIPSDLKINPQILAIWFCDDGSSNFKTRNAKISTHCFTLDENEFLVAELEKFNIKSKVYVDRWYDKPKPNIRITDSKSFYNLLEVIQPFIEFKCMMYKTDINKYLEPNYLSGAKLNKKHAVEVVKLYNNGMKQKDIAMKFELSQSAISNIVRRKSWKI